MKGKLFVMLFVAGVLSGCSHSGNALLRGGSAAAGGLAGYALSNGKAGGAAIGAASGALLSEGLIQWKKSSDRKAFEEGYAQGRADSTKAYYWRLQCREATQR